MKIPQVIFCDETYSGKTHNGDTCVLREAWEAKYTEDGIGAWTGTAKRMVYSDAAPAPSHANNNLHHFLNSTLPMILFFTLPYIPLWLIEKYKKISARSLQKLFLAVTAIYFGGTFSILLFTGVMTLIFNPHANFSSFGSFMFTFGLIGIPVLALGIILLYKSPIIRRLLKKIK